MVKRRWGLCNGDVSLPFHRGRAVAAGAHPRWASDGQTDLHQRGIRRSMSTHEQADAMLIAAMPFSAGLGIEMLASGAHEVRARMPWRPDLCTTAGLLHGGALMAFADSLGAVCAFLNLPAGATTTTIESKTNFLRGVRAGSVEGTTRPLHVGRRFIVVQTHLSDDAGKLVAQVTQTQAVLT